MDTIEPQITAKPFPKRLMHLLRRCHLFLGLLMIPWALLYGISGFLFNHPSILNDQPLTYFGSGEIRGTLLESIPSPDEIAGQVVAALKSADPKGDYQLSPSPQAKYNREYAFALVKAEGGPINALFEVEGGGGTITRPKQREQPKKPAVPFERRRNIAIETPLSDRFHDALPTILERTGYPTGEVVITSIPDLQFHLIYQGKEWIATYNAQTKTLSAKPADDEIKPPLSLRRSILQLHRANGYAASINAKWLWALMVDAMSCVLIFWAGTGILMWWQIQAVRWIGALTLLLSAIGAIGLVLAMHARMGP